MGKNRETDLPYNLHEIAPYVPKGALDRALALGEVPNHGVGRHSFRNGIERARTFAQQGDIFTDPVAAKKHRRQINLNLRRRSRGW